MENHHPIIATSQKKKNLPWWLAQFTSFLLHPLLLPTWAFGGLLLMGSTALGVDREKQVYFMTIVVSSTFIIPICLVLILYHLRLFESFMMQNREDRLLPFMVISLFYALFTYVLAVSNTAQNFSLLFVVIAGMTASIILVTLITYFWKISAHSTGMGGVTAVLSLLYYKFSMTFPFTPVLISIILLGTLMSARLHLGAHSPAQVWLGALLGFVVNLAVGLIYL